MEPLPDNSNSKRFKVQINWAGKKQNKTNSSSIPVYQSRTSWRVKNIMWKKIKNFPSADTSATKFSHSASFPDIKALRGHEKYEDVLSTCLSLSYPLLNLRSSCSSACASMQQTPTIRSWRGCGKTSLSSPRQKRFPRQVTCTHAALLSCLSESKFLPALKVTTVWSWLRLCDSISGAGGGGRGERGDG